jgi:hypothetical protein
LDNYYVYLYLDPRKSGNYNYGSYSFDYEPFYVGKGKCGRYKSHLKPKQLEEDNNKLKSNKIKKMIRENNLMPIVIKYKSDMGERESLDLEMDMIKCIGRKDKNLGPLTNLTDGGEGTSGYIMKEERKEKLRILHTGKKHTEETKLKFKEIFKRNWELNKELLLKKCHGHWKTYWTEEKRNDVAVKYKGKNNPNYGNNWTDEQKNHLSEIRKKTTNWHGDNNPSRKNPRKGKDNIYNKYKYMLYDKDGVLLDENYSITELGKKFNLNPGGLRKSAIIGSFYLNMYRVIREKYR